MRNRSGAVTDPRWCSWCGASAAHERLRERRRGRDLYQCSACGLPTVRCRYCDNMARAAVKSGEARTGEMAGGRLRRLVSEHWNHQLCAEHDGSIPDFERAEAHIRELPEFHELMRPRRRNLYATGKTSGAVLGGALVLGAGAWLTAPAIAAALGAKGALGAAGTGTAIKSLSGAALGSASLAKLGAGSTAMIAAAGAGLGGRTGYSLASAYLRDIPDFAFHELRAPAEDNDHRIVVVNGFLTQDDQDARDWEKGLEGFLPESGLCYLNWEAKTLRKLGNALGGTAGGFAVRSMVRQAAGAASGVMSRRFTRATALLTAADLAANPWHSAMLNAERTGALLAEAISRTDGRTFTLMGHSLGARVVMFALMALATKGAGHYVRDAVLMGAAVGRDRREDWERAASAVSGRIHNCYSEHDRVLRFLYQGANAGLSRPAGLAETQPEIVGVENRDFSDCVTDHNAWKGSLDEVTERLGLTGC